MTNALKLADFFDSELHSDLNEILVTKDAKGKYMLFGKYFIVPITNGHFKVFIIGHNSPVEFSTLKNATSWCVLHNSGKQFEANRIEALDLKLCSMNVDIAIHKKLARTSIDSFNKLIYTIKLQEDTHKRRLIVQEINNYINTSKRIQEDNFRKKDPNFNY